MNQDTTAMNQMNLSEYELLQIDEIQKWKDAEPGVVSETIALVTKPVSWAVEKVFPEQAVRGALDMSNSFGKWLSDKNDIIRDGQVEEIADLKHKELETSDKLANEIHNWAIGMAAAEGAGTGALGLPGIVLDIPAVITLALRTIHKIGLCYGFEAETKSDQEFILGVMAASGANTVNEKTAALAYLRTIEVTIAQKTWKKMAEIAAASKLSNEGAVIAIKNLAKQLGVNLTKRKALAAIPIIGAAVSGSVNGWFLKEVGWAARYAFQERWLIENKKTAGV